MIDWRTAYIRGLGFGSLLGAPIHGLGFWIQGVKAGVRWRLSLLRIPESWNMGLGGLVLGSLILYLKGMRILMLQLSCFCYRFLSDSL